MIGKMSFGSFTLNLLTFNCLIVNSLKLNPKCEALMVECIHGKVHTLPIKHLAAKPKLDNLYLIKGAFRQASFEAQMLHQLNIYKPTVIILYLSST